MHNVGLNLVRKKPVHFSCNAKSQDTIGDSRRHGPWAEYLLQLLILSLQLLICSPPFSPLRLWSLQGLRAWPAMEENIRVSHPVWRAHLRSWHPPLSTLPDSTCLPMNTWRSCSIPLEWTLNSTCPLECANIMKRNSLIHWCNNHWGEKQAGSAYISSYFTE